MLSTAEGNYITCSKAISDLVNLMRLMEGINLIFPLNMPKAEVYCNVHEENEAMVKRRKSSFR